MASIHQFGFCTPPRRKGMTLIEIIIVVGIIGLLASILLESLANARRQMWRIECASNLRAVGNAFNLYAIETSRYPYVGNLTLSRTEAFDDLGKALPPILVRHSLGDPRAFYCPASLRKDIYSGTPYRRSGSGQIIEEWRGGIFSYITLFSVMYSFPDADGQPTFDPLKESPHRNYYGKPMNHSNPRVVLTGDRVVERAPGTRSKASSNHGQEGGWFYFTTGDAQWRPWKTLTGHTTPAKKHIWYWPSMVNRTPVDQTAITTATR